MKTGFADWLLFRVVPRLGAGVIRLLHRTMRAEIVGEEILRGYWSRGENVIFAIWHDQLLLMVNAYRGPGARILISQSKDGELIAKTLECFGLGAVRGSSSRGGRKAFRALLALAREPYDLAITPDGPRGPRHQVKEGVVQLARLSGRPVVPLSFACSRGYRFSSWDRFLLPFPFSRGVFVFGEPLVFHKEESIESFQQRLTRNLADNLGRAQQRLEEHGVSAV